MLMSEYLPDASCPKKKRVFPPLKRFKQTPVPTGDEGKNGPLQAIQKKGVLPAGTETGPWGMGEAPQHTRT